MLNGAPPGLAAFEEPLSRVFISEIRGGTAECWGVEFSYSARETTSKSSGHQGLRQTSEVMASPVGIEPTTCGLEVRCSIQLGYGLVGAILARTLGKLWRRAKGPRQAKPRQFSDFVLKGGRFLQQSYGRTRPDFSYYGRLRCRALAPTIAGFATRYKRPKWTPIVRISRTGIALGPATSLNKIVRRGGSQTS
jgi:hypothetical protein